MEYLFQGRLDNTVHDITEDHIHKLYEDNLAEEEETRRITASTYRGETFFTAQSKHRSWEYDQEFNYRVPRTAGGRCYYPHGIVIQQGARRNYYRGENQIFKASISSLLRKLGKFEKKEDKALYRLIADMRIAEFSFLLQKFEHVRKWKESDILYDTIAQHYGLETGWLDITSDFNVALFFATCFWNEDHWEPLTKKQTEIDETHQHGMIFHMPSNRMQHRILQALENLKPWTDEPIGKTEDGNVQYGKLEHPIYRHEMPNVIYPIGFQPFMRCSMQNGYGIYMRTAKPLQEDLEFEKLRFRHSEKLSRWIYDLMDGGRKVYPHEGLVQVQFLIDQIRTATEFSEEAFRFALYRSHEFRLEEDEQVREKLRSFLINGEKIKIDDSHPWKLSAGKRKRVDYDYRDFSFEEWYGIHVLDRPTSPGSSAFFEPWMYPEKIEGPGVTDFKLREKVECGDTIAVRNMTAMLYELKNMRLADY